LGDDTSRPLALADRRDDVDDAAGHVLFRLDVALGINLVRKQSGSNRILLAFSGGSPTLSTRPARNSARRRGHFESAFDRIARMEIEAADLRGRDKIIVRAGEIEGIRRTKKRESVGWDFQRSIAEMLARSSPDSSAARRSGRTYASVGAVDLVMFAISTRFSYGLGLEFGQLHGWAGGGAERGGPEDTRGRAMPLGVGAGDRATPATIPQRRHSPSGALIELEFLRFKDCCQYLR
jgi:hypothetical protein